MAENIDHRLAYLWRLLKSWEFKDSTFEKPLFSFFYQCMMYIEQYLKLLIFWSSTSLRQLMIIIFSNFRVNILSFTLTSTRTGLFERIKINI